MKKKIFFQKLLSQEMKILTWAEQSSSVTQRKIPVKGQVPTVNCAEAILTIELTRKIVKNRIDSIFIFAFEKFI